MNSHFFSLSLACFCFLLSNSVTVMAYEDDRDVFFQAMEQCEEKIRAFEISWKVERDSELPVKTVLRELGYPAGPSSFLMPMNSQLCFNEGNVFLQRKSFAMSGGKAIEINAILTCDGEKIYNASPTYRRLLIDTLEEKQETEGNREFFPADILKFCGIQTPTTPSQLPGHPSFLVLDLMRKGATIQRFDDLGGGLVSLKLVDSDAIYEFEIDKNFGFLPRRYLKKDVEGMPIFDSSILEHTEVENSLGELFFLPMKSTVKHFQFERSSYRRSPLFIETFTLLESGICKRGQDSFRIIYESPGDFISDFSTENHFRIPASVNELDETLATIDVDRENWWDYRFASVILVALVLVFFGLLVSLGKIRIEINDCVVFALCWRSRLLLRVELIRI